MNISGEINWYLGDDLAKLKFSESQGAFSIDSIMVPAVYRNKGIGRTLISHILILADQMGKCVRVSVRPIGEFSEERLQRLIRYYKSFGFEIEDRGHSIAYLVKNIMKK